MPGLRERIAEALEDAIWPKDKPHESLLTELREKCYLPWADAVMGVVQPELDELVVRAWRDRRARAGRRPGDAVGPAGGVMPGLRERIAEALGYPSFLSDDVKRVDVDRVMAVVQRDLDELEAAVADAQLALLDAQDEEADVDQRIRDGVLRALRLVGERDAAEADAARLAEALWSYASHAAPHEDEFTTGDVWRYGRANAALAAHREREKEAR